MDYPPSRQRTPSFSSRVDLGHFDPIGVEQLQRTMSQLSVLRRQQSEQLRGRADSDMTLHPGEGPFDLERALQHHMRRYVSVSRL